MTEADLLSAFEALKEMVAAVPQSRRERKNMLQIAGYPHWENVISNILAFYFDENEDHNFQRLFYDSLLQVLVDNEVKVEDSFTETSYGVSREYQNIDILITSDNVSNGKNDWAIIIENKIHAELYNNLKKYWESVQAAYKIGVVLNLYGQPQNLLEKHKPDNIVFHNVLYRDLIEKVKINLHRFFENSDDRHLLLLKDFLHNINQNYINKLMTPEMQNKLTLYHKNFEVLDKVRNIEGELHDYVSDCLFRALMKFDFLPYTSSFRVKTKHFYVDEKSSKKMIGMEGFRIFVSIEALLKYNKLILYFELFDQYTQHGKAIKDSISKKIEEYGDVMQTSAAGYEGGQYYHIAGIHGYDLNKEKKANLYEILVDVFERNLFIKDGLVEESGKLLANLLKSDK